MPFPLTAWVSAMRSRLAAPRLFGRRRPARPIRIEALEVRALLATANLTDGVLSIQFTATGATAEAVTLVSDGTNLTLTGITSGGSVFGVGQVQAIVVQDSGGSSGQSFTILAGSGLNLSEGFTSTGVETFTLNARLDAGGADVDIATDTIAINRVVTTTGTVTFRNHSSGRQISLGTEIAGRLSLTDAELDRVTAGLLQIGSSTSGTVDRIRGPDTCQQPVPDLGSRIDIQQWCDVGGRPELDRHLQHYHRYSQFRLYEHLDVGDRRHCRHCSQSSRVDRDHALDGKRGNHTQGPERIWSWR